MTKPGDLPSDLLKKVGEAKVVIESGESASKTITGLDAMRRHLNFTLPKKYPGEHVAIGYSEVENVLAPHPLGEGKIPENVQELGNKWSINSKTLEAIGSRYVELGRNAYRETHLTTFSPAASAVLLHGILENATRPELTAEQNATIQKNVALHIGRLGKDYAESIVKPTYDNLATPIPEYPARQTSQSAAQSR